MYIRKIILRTAGILLALGAANSLRTGGEPRVHAQNATPPSAAQPQTQQQSPGQQPATSPAAAQAPVAIHTTTRLVQVSVVVHDKHGNPISGLTKDDFAILDEKKPQAIQVFSEETNLPPTHSPPPLPPDTYTNRLAEQAGVPTSVTVILLDGLNTKFSDQHQAKEQVIKFLSQIHPEDRVALYTLGREVQILHDFTTDSSSLLDALERFKGRQNTEVDASQPDQPVDLSSVPGTEQFQAFLDGAAQQEANFYTADRVRLTVDGLIAIADHIGSLPGRKNLVWVSGSFPISVGYDVPDLSSNNERIDFYDEVQRAAQALNEANLAVYPVDARGLIPGNPSMNASQPSARRRTAGPPRGPASPPNPSEFATLDEMASRTGGKASYNSNDIFGAIRRALDDSRITYSLGYYPEGVAWDRKFHNIKVEVKKPGMEIRARKGYFAIEESKRKPEDVKAVLAEASMSPLDATAIGVRVKLSPGDSAAPRSLKAELHFDLRDFSMEQINGRWTGTLDAAFSLLDAKDQILSGENQNMKLNLEPARYDKALKEGVRYTKTVTVPPGATILRVILRDEATGNIGSVSIPLAKYASPANAAQ
jgi:VWFA-related protein